jgi:hypothetical protein
MTQTNINDTRKQKDFNTITFSQYQKTKVKKELIQSIINNKIEAACYWTAELICSGHFIDLWDTIILFISKHIHLGNPKLPIYIATRIDSFKEIVSEGYNDNELAMRNNKSIRELFAEIIAILCISQKKHIFDTIALNKDDAFDMSIIATKLNAPTITFAHGIFRTKDPKELFIAINELAYNLSQSTSNTINCCYWIEWILEFENRCKKKKDKCIIERRAWAPVLDCFQMDPIWIIWDVIFQEVNKRHCSTIKKILDALLRIYCIRFTPGIKRKRKFVLYFAISLLTEPINFNIPILSQKDKAQKVIKKIDIVYKEVKKNEIAPATDYLFTGIRDSTSLENTFKRLEIINKYSKL